MADEYNSSFTGLQIDTAIGKVGTSQLNTTAQNLSDAVNEVNSGKAGETIVATREISTTASKAYSVGEYLILGGVLYEVIDDIASGGTIVVSGSGANVETTDVGSELNQLKNTLNSKADEESIALRRSGATNTGAQIKTGTFFYLDGTMKRAIATIAQNASFTAQNCETVTAGGLNALVPSLSYSSQDLTPHGCTIINGGYAKFGNIVIVNIRITLTEIPVYVSGLPVPLTASGVYIGGGAYEATSDDSGYFYIDLSGTLRIPTKFGSSGALLISVVYLTA